jgi:hypothetical protein
MGYPTRIQLIDRKASRQWYVNFPAAIAESMQFERGEIMEWIVADKRHLILRRRRVPALPVSIRRPPWRGTASS